MYDDDGRRQPARLQGLPPCSFAAVVLHLYFVMMWLCLVGASGRIEICDDDGWVLMMMVCDCIDCKDDDGAYDWKSVQ